MSTVSTLLFHKIRRTCIQKHSWEITQNMQPGKDLPFSWKNRCLSSSIRLASNSFCQKERNRWYLLISKSKQNAKCMNCKITSSAIFESRVSSVSVGRTQISSWISRTIFVADLLRSGEMAGNSRSAHLFNPYR